MTNEVFKAWFAASVDRKAEDRARSSGRSVSVERAALDEMIPLLLPDGVKTAGHAFWMVQNPSEDLVGGLWLGPGPQTADDERFLFDIYVEPKHRRNGVGRWMLETAIERVHHQGFLRITLHVRRDNAPALSLYRSLGFRSSGNSDEATWITMTRLLAA
jgi:ribosomal protein S18 acetylase RimI-like enzyme